MVAKKIDGLVKANKKKEKNLEWVALLTKEKHVPSPSQVQKYEFVEGWTKLRGTLSYFTQNRGTN